TNVAPDDRPSRFVTVVTSDPMRPWLAIFSDCAKFTLPVPEATRPAAGMNRAPICIEILICSGVSDGCELSRSATPPLTTAVDMLVPESLRYAFLPDPAMCHCGYVRLR